MSCLRMQGSLIVITESS
ncbi:hypothetical protein AZE42_07165 [Rhizopogon vesiculosus]|uniref:Uncharacterized protein n=1 Tax=Rhizopogon vesiculosus TaxID=180088 RepID=A0A1J8PTG2_9AGAM|nr:hypothetical protein AZE42_07165 [Rhizopogon vesiculosus]